MRQFVVENERAGRDSTRVINLFDRIMEQDQDDAQMPMLYAQYLLAKKMNKETMPVLERVLDIDPTNTAARMTLLGEAIRKEDYKEVIRLCEAGIESNPDMLEFYFYLSIAYNQADRTDDALAICKKGLENIPEKSDKEFVSNFYAIMGDFYHTKKMNTEAYAAYDSALVYNSANLGALNNYAYYLSLERRDLDKAEEMSYKTVKSEPTNTAAIITALQTVAKNDITIFLAAPSTSTDCKRAKFNAHEKPVQAQVTVTIVVNCEKSPSRRTIPRSITQIKARTKNNKLIFLSVHFENSALTRHKPPAVIKVNGI